MAKKILIVGLDVDDKAFHAGLIALDDGELLELSCKPTVGALEAKLKKYEQKGYQIKICYEACHLGFGLCRDLRKRGWHCDVISPSDIPQPAGLKVKTDRLDANKLARYYANGLLNPIFVPEEEQEAERDLVRTRRFLKEQASDLKRYILSQCRRAGINYRAAEGQEPGSHHWSARHRQWLQGAIGHLQSPSWKINLSALLLSLRHLEQQVVFYDQEIEKLATHSRYQAGVQALGCYRGLDTLSSMTILTEIGTIKRFSHPRQLTSFSGMDIAEYSSGGKEKKLGITKMGNTHLRRTVIESCQFAWKRPALSQPLRKRRERAPSPQCIDIAERCMKRLYQRSNHLMQRGKHRNQIKVACARELWGFVWESLRAVNF